MIEVLVGRNQLKTGQRNHGRACPIALGIRETCDAESNHVHVGYKEIELFGEKYKLSGGLKKWLKEFDDSKPIKAIRVFLSDGKARMETIGVTFMRKNRNGSLVELEDKPDGN